MLNFAPIARERQTPSRRRPESHLQRERARQDRVKIVSSPLGPSPGRILEGSLALVDVVSALLIVAVAALVGYLLATLVFPERF